MDATELPLYLGRIGDALASRGATAAANAMAEEFHTELRDVTLRKSSHPRGTVTPSRPGDPPALVSGILRNSASIVPAAAAGTRAVSAVRVGVVYARIQEKGGTVTAKRAKFLKFQYPSGKWHAVKSAHIPARPYMRPTRDLLVTSGRLQARADQAVAAVIREGGA